MKCAVRWCGLPLVTTFKILHGVAYLSLHALLYEGLKFTFVLFPKCHMATSEHYGYYYLQAVYLSLVAIFMVMAYYRCICTGPGFVKDYLPQTQRSTLARQAITEDTVNTTTIRDVEAQDYYKVASDPESQTPVLNYDQAGPNVPREEQQRQTQGRWEWCDVCELEKKWFSHHCMICQKCVIRMDHHCPWVMGCVGYLNYQYFLQFAFWAGMWTSSIALYTFMFKESMTFDYWDYTFYVCIGLLQFFAWGVFVMYGLMALKGLTVIEAAEHWSSKRTRPTNLPPGSILMINNENYKDNLKLIFGTESPLLALLPLRRAIISPEFFQ